jgi:NADH-quinone oxidoreductase subunit C
MRRTLKQLADALGSKFSSRIINSAIALEELTVQINATDISDIARSLKDDFGFDQLIDVCGVDYAHYGFNEWQTSAATASGFSRGFTVRTHGRGQTVKQIKQTDKDVTHPSRYAVVYHLISIQENQRIRVKAWCEDNDFPMIASVVEIWPAANWFEREAFDLLGIAFEGHPDLRRILTDYGFIGHPFRKDFPLSGNVEMRYDAEKGRVVYEPVSIEPRVLVPRVVRKESGAGNA